MTNHPKDRHVLAAAIYADCTTILTYNKKDFITKQTQKIEILTPDEFLIDFANEKHENFAKFINALQIQRSYLTNPPLSAQEYLDLLDGDGQGIPLTAKKCRKFVDEI